MAQEGKVALITGSIQGIGRALAENLLEQKAKVVLSGRDASRGEETLKELALKYGDAVKFVKCDVTSDTEFEDAIKQTIKVFGSLDLLINNAGTLQERNPVWKNTIEVNFTSTVRGTYLGMKYMDKQKDKNGGTIVNVASTGSYLVSGAIPVYSATKSAVAHFTRCVGTHYNKTGVKTLCIHPHGTETTLAKSNAEHLLIPLPAKPIFPILQSPDHVGKGLINILEVAESGSLWVIEDCLPPKKLEFTVEKLDLFL